MTDKDSNKTRLFTNDLNRNSDSDTDPDSGFDLDDYIREQSLPDDEQLKETAFSEDQSSFKNALLIGLVCIATFLWVNDWSVSQAWGVLFGESETVTQVVNSAPGTTVQGPTAVTIPEPPSIAPPSPPAPALDMTITEYLSILRDKGYLGDEISSFSARQLYDGNVSLNYLDNLESAGLLEGLSFVDITSFYSNNIPFSYLAELETAGIRDQLSFVDITNFHENNIPTQHLIELNEAGYLEELSFVHITSFYNNGVPIEFLNQLKEQGIYEDLSFIDIVDLYKRENGN